MCDILTRYADTAKTTKLGLTIGWIQLDHQLENCVAPVILAPTPVQSVQPTLQLSVLKDNMRSTSGLHSFMYCGILIQELDLKVEEDIIQSLWVFVQGVLRDRSKRHAARDEGGKIDDFQNAFEEVEEEKGGDQGRDGDDDLGMVGTFLRKKLYIEELSLGSVKVNVSYTKSTQSRNLETGDDLSSKNETLSTRLEKNKQKINTMKFSDIDDEDDDDDDDDDDDEKVSR